MNLPIEATATNTESPTVLIVDDDEKTLTLHSLLLRRFGFQVELAADGIEALAKLGLGVDLMVLDADMPMMDGFEVARRIRNDPRHRGLPIVMITGLSREADRRRAGSVAIDVFLQKPVVPEALEARATLLLRQWQPFAQSATQRAEGPKVSSTDQLRRSLEETTRAKRHLYDAHLDTIRRLTLAAEFKDPDTARHIERIGLYSAVVAREMDFSPGEIATIRHAAPMHDVGKLGIPDRILSKPGALTDEEWTIMKTHSLLGEGLLSGSKSPILRMGALIAATHHERWDGGGYPHGLEGDAIPIEGRICGLVDFFDALTFSRPYREAIDNETVIEMIRGAVGAHFDPAVFRAFLRGFNEILTIQSTHP